MIRGMVCFVAVVVLCALPAPAVTVSPGEGVSFGQMDFLWPSAETLNSDTGQIDVDIAFLQTATSLSSGYLNVATDAGWVVQNLPVLSGFPYPSISSNFGLGSTVGDDVTSLTATVDFSAAPVTAFAPAPSTVFAVGDVGYDAQGKGAAVPAAPPAPVAPAAGVVAFQLGGLVQVVAQPNHTLVQTAHNQCGPAAVASSLQYLEDTFGVSVPHDHVSGLLGVPANSLVGQLDTAMGRAATSRADGDAVLDLVYVEGKLSYLDNNGLEGLIVKHQDDEFGDMNVTVAGVTSHGRGKVPTAEFIIQELLHGEDVEMGFSYKTGGGHWVEVVGAGYILGVPWVAHRSDSLQTSSDPTDTMGIDGTDFSFLVDTDMDGLLNLVYGKADANVDIVVTQSIPEPGTMLGLVVGVGGLARYLRRRLRR